MTPQTFRDFLHSEFVQRCQKNQRYSLRAYARSIGVDHSTLSQILRGKRTLSQSMFVKLVKQFELTQEQTDLFLQEFKNPKKKVADYKSLTLDTYAVISDWYHFAIFELVTVKTFQPDVAWIAGTLSISHDEAKAAVDRLFNVGLLVVDENGGWRQSSQNVTTLNNDFTATAFRNLQKGLLGLSLKALEEVPFEKRSHTSMTMAFNSKKLPEAKERITKFRRELCDWLQKDDCRDAVYEMTLSLFPVTPIQSETL